MLNHSLCKKSCINATCSDPQRVNIDFDHWRPFLSIDCMQHSACCHGSGPILHDTDNAKEIDEGNVGDRREDAYQIQRAYFS